MLFEDEARRALRLTMDIAERSIDAMFAGSTVPRSPRPPLVRRRATRELGPRPSTPTLENRGRSRSRSHGRTVQGRRSGYQVPSNRPRSAHRHRTRVSHAGGHDSGKPRVPPRRPAHPAPSAPASRSSQPQRRMFGGGVSASSGAQVPPPVPESSPTPSLTVTFPAGFHIGGLVSPPSPAAVETMLSTLASRSPTFQSLRPLHQLVPANARRRVTAYLLSHPQFLDACLVKRIMEEWHGDITPANNQEVTIPTSVGDLRIALATRIVRQLITAAPTPVPDATLEPTADGTTAYGPCTPEPPIRHTDVQADAPPPTLASSGVPTLSGAVRAPGSAATPVVPAAYLNAETASGPTALPEGLPPSAPLAEDVTSLPSPVPLAGREEPVPHPALSQTGHDPIPAPAEAVDGLVPPHLYQASAIPPPTDSTSIAPMTPPTDCELTPQLRGVEYLLGDNCLLPVSSCTSCLQPFEVGETLVRLACMHYFHKECVTRWFSSPFMVIAARAAM